jgi:hypothetical protein
MENITLKELSAYLPYGLKCNLTLVNFSRTNVVLLDFELRYSFVFKNYHVRIANVTYGLEDIKIHLRPLSDLTKEIEVKGKRFVPIENLPIIGMEVLELESDIKSGCIEQKIYNTLLEWHFDLFNLIDRGLAINLNSI